MNSLAFQLAEDDEMKDAYYFPHDSNARNDERILELRSKFGMEGYGIYFCLLEMMRESNDHHLDSKRLPAIAFGLNVAPELLNDVLTLLKENGSIVVTGSGQLFSPAFLRRMEELENKRLKYVQAGKKSAELRALKNDVPTSLERRSTMKGKERKVNIKEKIYKKESPEESEKELKLRAPGVLLTDSEFERLPEKLTSKLKQFSLPATAGTVEGLLNFYSLAKENGYSAKCDRAAIDKWAIGGYIDELLKDARRKSDAQRVGMSASQPERPNMPQNKIFRAVRRGSTPQPISSLVENPSKNIQQKASEGN